MARAWKYYFIGFFLLLLYGYGPPMLSGKAHSIINLIEGTEYKVEYFQLIRSPLNIWIDEKFLAKLEKLKSNSDELDGKISIKVNDRDEFLYEITGVGLSRKYDRLIQSVDFGSNIIHIKIASIPYYLRDEFVTLNFYGPNHNLKSGLNPSWVLDPISVMASIFGYIAFGLIAFGVQIFVRFILK